MSTLWIAALALSQAQEVKAPAPKVEEKKPAEVKVEEPKFPVELVADRKPKLKTGGNVLIKNARILTVTKGIIDKGDVLVKAGKIVAVGSGLKAPSDTVVIDAAGKVLAPGFVDAHIHRGADSTNEGSDSIVAECRIIDVLNPDNKNVWQAVASGETTGLILHGSANPAGAQSLVVKLKYGRPATELPVPDAPRMIKFALGENVTRSGQSTSARYPRTRMGVESVYRRGFTEAKEYKKAWADYEAKKKTDPKAVKPQRDLRLEALRDILDRKIWVQCHSYRADEILMMVRLSQEFGFKIGAMQHALEAYKIAPELAKAGVGASMFIDDWAGKLEMYDGNPYGPSILQKAGALVSINTDGTGGTTALNIDAAKVMRFGGLNETQALSLITINPAKELGVDHRVGSIEVGKDADLVIWSGHPLSVYSKVETTLIEGEVFFQRRDAHKVDAIKTSKTKLAPSRYVANPPLPAKGDLYAIVGGTVHTVDGPVIAGGTVLVKSGKILEVGKKVAIPKGAIVVQAAGKHVYPGLIDAGTTVGLTEFGQVGQATDARELGSFQPDLVAATAVQAQSEHIRTTRANGVTSVVTMPLGGSVSGQASLLFLDGYNAEQLAFRKKLGVVVNWAGGFSGGFDTADQRGVGDDQFASYDSICCYRGTDSNLSHDPSHQHEDEAMGAGQGQGGTGSSSGNSEVTAYFEKAAKYGRSHTKTDLGLEAMQPVFRKELPVFIRVSGRAGIRTAVAFIKKFGLRGILVGVPDAWKETKLLSENKIPVIITNPGLSTLDANSPVNDWDPYDTPYALPYLLKKGGVEFCFQSDSYAEAKNLPERLAQSCGYGLKPEDALKAATLSAAKILGVGDQIGSITKGKIANLVIADGDLFELTTSIHNVFINGKPVSLKNKFTRLRDQYEERLK